VRIKYVAALALTALSETVHAQSSVTLYGQVDSGLMYQNTGSIFRMKDGGIYTSFLGFKGTEDLGGGWQANFKLQGAFDSTTGKFGLSGTAGQGSSSIRLRMLAWPVRMAHLTWAVRLFR
jgi:predicted porin